MNKNIKYFFILSSLLVVASLTNCKKNNYEDLGEKVEERTLNIFALNDFHGATLYDERYSQAGLSKIGNYLINQKTENKDNTIIINSGDMFQGGAESNITYGKEVIDIMNEIEFDSMTVGNHEFDWGEDKLYSFANDLNCDFLGFNVYYKNGNRPQYLKPSTCVYREGLKIGIIGAVQPGIESSIVDYVANNFNFPNQINEIKNEAQRLRNNNCDVVILSSHDGVPERYAPLEGYIDALFLGHEHEKLSGTLGSKLPYIEGACNGEYLSKISLDLKLNSNNRYEIKSFNYQNINTFETFKEDNSKINEIIEEYEKTVSPIRDEILYTFESSLTTKQFGDFIAKCLYTYGNNEFEKVVSLGCINFNGVRNIVPEGKFTYGDLIKVYPFENTFSLLKIEEKDYSYYRANSGFYRYYDGLLPVLDKDGFVYIATIDYIAFKSASPKVEMKNYSNILCRDVIKNILLNEGYLE